MNETFRFIAQTVINLIEIESLKYKATYQILMITVMLHFKIYFNNICFGFATKYSIDLTIFIVFRNEGMVGFV